MYLSNNSDTIVFNGQGRYSEEFQSPFDGTSSNKYYTNEIDRCSFIDEENKYELYIQLASRTRSTHQRSQSKTYTGYLLDIWFKDQTGINTTDCRSIASNVGLPIIDYQNKNFFYDSLLINGVYYSDVIAFTKNNFLLFDGSCSGKMKTDTIFYCTSNGIIKLSFSNNESWSLLNNNQN